MEHFNDLQRNPLILLYLTLIIGVSCDDIQTLFTGEAFFTKYSLNHTKIGRPDELDVVGSVRDYPDLPLWMNYFHRKHSSTGYFYGTPIDDGDVEIEIILTNVNSLVIGKDRLKYRIENRDKHEDTKKFEIEMKFFEIDLEDIFEKNIVPILLDIFRNHLGWNSGQVFVSCFAQPSLIGGRLPLDPNEKEGVIIRVANSKNFTTRMYNLAAEVEPIRNRNPCPKRYKASSIEYIFREQSLYVDWCQFRLLP